MPPQACALLTGRKLESHAETKESRRVRLGNLVGSDTCVRLKCLILGRLSARKGGQQALKKRDEKAKRTDARKQTCNVRQTRGLEPAQ